MYKNAPSAFVSANHTSSGGGLDPMHNSITAWVEVSQRSAWLRAVINNIFEALAPVLAVRVFVN